MKKIILSIIAILLISHSYSQDLFLAKNVLVGFYSKTPLEDIEAESKIGYGVMQLGKKELNFTIKVNSFNFPRPLMQEHFNENYMESDKYPNASFKGKINEEYNLTADGVYKVTATGKLEMHGVEKERTIDGVLTVKNGQIALVSSFKVKCVDHKIDIPKVVIAKIADEVTVSVNGTFNPFTGNK